MINLQTRELIRQNLDRVNSINTIKYSMQFQEDTIFVFIKETFITRNHCKIDYYEDASYILITFYNYELSKYEEETFKLEKASLFSQLEGILTKNHL